MQEIAPFDPVALRATGTAIKLGLALVATCLLGWGALADRKGQGGAGKRLRDGLLVVLAAAATAGWWNFFAFHYGGPERSLPHVHDWDAYHYFVGAKYFDELGYTHLYTCSVAAGPDAWRAERGAGPVVRNLLTNRLESPRPADLRACRTRFSASRWAAFQADIAWFRGRIPNWNDVFLDWGFNATPVWIAFGQALIGDRPASSGVIAWRTLVDVPLLALGFASVAWAFGWRVLCVVLVFWGTNLPADYGWTGGSLLRHPWFALLLSGIALLRREHAFLGGAALGTATALRIFPGAVFGGLALLGLLRLVDRSNPHALTRSLRIGAGALAALAVLALSAAPSTQGFSTWLSFASNSAVDTVPSANNIGLKGILAHREHDKWAMVKGMPSSVSRWERGRSEALASREGWRIAGIAAGIVLLGAAAIRHREEDWVAATLSIGAVPIAFHLASYYHACIVVFALLAGRQPWIGVGLCALAAFSQATVYFGLESDERYVWLSVGWIGFVAVSAAGMIFATKPTARSGA